MKFTYNVAVNLMIHSVLQNLAKTSIICMLFMTKYIAVMEKSEPQLHNIIHIWRVGVKKGNAN